MTLNDEIRRNWSMDVVGMCQELRSLYRRGFPAWTIKLSDGSFGVAIPYDEEDDVNERFANVHLTTRMNVKLPDSSETVRAIVLLSTVRGVDAFAQVCEDFVSPGVAGANRFALLKDPSVWWRKWKELIGNKNVDSRVYDVLGELCAIRAIVRQGIPATWRGQDRASYDIETPAGYFEVKSTVVRDHKEVTIHSQFQLDPPDGKSLSLLLCQFEEMSGLGETINDVVSDLEDLGVDVASINETLAAAGFEEGCVARKEGYALHSILRYDVGCDFPRITTESFVGGVLPQGVSKISYTVDLDGLSATRVE